MGEMLYVYAFLKKLYFTSLKVNRNCCQMMQ